MGRQKVLRIYPHAHAQSLQRNGPTQEFSQATNQRLTQVEHKLNHFMDHYVKERIKVRNIQCVGAQLSIILERSVPSSSMWAPRPRNKQWRRLTHNNLAKFGTSLLSIQEIKHYISIQMRCQSNITYFFHNSLPTQTISHIEESSQREKKNVDKNGDFEYFYMRHMSQTIMR